MSLSKPEQLRFHAIDGMTVRTDFEGGALSSDSGAILLCKTENQVGLIDRLTLEHFVASYAAPPEVIVLELDHTNHWVYGQQKLALFNTYYCDDCHLPLLIFEDLSGRLISALLRPGKSPTGRENAAILKRVLARVTEIFYRTPRLKP